MPPNRRLKSTASQTAPLNAPIHKLFRSYPPPINPLIPELTQDNNLCLLTYTLSVSPVWLVKELVKRWLSGVGLEEDEETGKRGVVLVSFTREPMMWEAVCSMEGDASTTSVAEHSSSAAAARPQRQSIGEIENEQPPVFTPGQFGPLPNRSGPSPATTAVLLATRPRVPSSTDPATPVSQFTVIDGLSQLFYPQPAPKPLTEQLRWSKDTTEEEVKMKTLTQRIANVITRVKSKYPNVLLVLDGLDFVQSATGTTSSAIIDATLDLRQMTSASVITAAGDKKLLSSPKEPLNPLARAHTRLLASLTHTAHSVFQLRSLDTGVARDITGVLRINRGCNGSDEYRRGLDMEVGREEFSGEYLYRLVGDGGVRVFQRGQ